MANHIIPDLRGIGKAYFFPNIAVRKCPIPVAPGRASRQQDIEVVWALTKSPTKRRSIEDSRLNHLLPVERVLTEQEFDANSLFTQPDSRVAPSAGSSDNKQWDQEEYQYEARPFYIPAAHKHKDRHENHKHPEKQYSEGRNPAYFIVR